MKEPKQIWNAYVIIKGSGTDEEIRLRNELIEFYIPRTKALVGEVIKKKGLYHIFEDLRDEACSTAFESLIRLVERYDPDKNTKFSTYMVKRIRGTVLDWIRSLKLYGSRTFAKTYNELDEKLTTEKEREPTEDELLEKLSMTQHQLNNFKRGVVSIERILNNKGEIICAVSKTRGINYDFVREVENQDMINALMNSDISDRQKEILRKHFLEGVTYIDMWKMLKYKSLYDLYAERNRGIKKLRKVFARVAY